MCRRMHNQRSAAWQLYRSLSEDPGGVVADSFAGVKSGSMSLPVENARLMVQSMHSAGIRNLIAQSKAKQVLREVREIPANFPGFEPDLDDRVTFVAYGAVGGWL